ncbi:MAG: PaaI family thioesterase [Thermoanaerobaculia bacterium]
MSEGAGAWIPANPEFAAVVRDSFGRQRFMRTLGATLDLVTPGVVGIAFPFDEALCQQNEYLHAGVLTSTADSACGYAALSLLPAGTDVLSVEFKINLLAPARGEKFLALARVLRAGRTLTVASAEVFANPAAERTLVAVLTATIISRASLTADRGSVRSQERP